MPWNRIYYPAGSLTAEDKEALAQGITDIYAKNYPKNATLVAFFPFEQDGFFKGGKLSSNFFRITLQHMKGSYSTAELENVVRTKFRDVLKPYIEDRGMNYELQIEEIPSNEISFDNFVAYSVLADPLLNDMLKEGELFPVKTVRA